MSDYSIYPKGIDGYAQIPLAVYKETHVKADIPNRRRSAVIYFENDYELMKYEVTALQYVEFLNSLLATAISVTSR